MVIDVRAAAITARYRFTVRCWSVSMLVLSVATTTPQLTIEINEAH